MAKQNKFKDTGGRWLTIGLFYDITYKPEFAIYVIGEEDVNKNGVTYPSLKKLYLEIADPTEYRFAIECLGGLRHWNKLLKNKDIKEHVDEWREELEVKLRSDAIKNIIEESKSDSKSAYQASKWLADRGWEKKRKAGAPTKQEKEGIIKGIEKEISEFDEDYERIIN